MDSNEKKDKIDWDAPTEAATLSQIEGEMERLRDLVSLMENDAKPLEDSKEKGITLLYEYMGQLFLLHSEVEKLNDAEEDYDMAREIYFDAKERCEELAESLEPAQVYLDEASIRLEEAKEYWANTMGELSEEPEDDNFDEAAPNGFTVNPNSSANSPKTFFNRARIRSFEWRVNRSSSK